MIQRVNSCYWCHFRYWEGGFFIHPVDLFDRVISVDDFPNQRFGPIVQKSRAIVCPAFSGFDRPGSPLFDLLSSSPRLRRAIKLFPNRPSYPRRRYASRTQCSSHNLAFAAAAAAAAARCRIRRNEPTSLASSDRSFAANGIHH